MATGVFIISMNDTFPTRCIWSRLAKHFNALQSIVVKDETHEKAWHIRVLQPVENNKNKVPTQ
jgi:hypothetical protein